MSRHCLIYIRNKPKTFCTIWASQMQKSYTTLSPELIESYRFPKVHLRASCYFPRWKICISCLHQIALWSINTKLQNQTVVFSIQENTNSLWQYKPTKDKIHSTNLALQRVLKLYWEWLYGTFLMTIENMSPKTQEGNETFKCNSISLIGTWNWMTRKSQEIEYCIVDSASQDKESHRRALN